MSDLSQIRREESLNEDFYTYLQQGDWPRAKNCIVGLKEMYIPTARFEKDLQDAIKEGDDIEFIPYEHVIPTITKEEEDAWTDVPTYSGRSKVSEIRAGLEHGSNNA